MALPKSREYFLLVLKALADGQEHSLQAIYAAVARAARLTEDEQNQLMPNRSERWHDNRVRWAINDLKKEGLIRSPRWGSHCHH